MSLIQDLPIARKFGFTFGIICTLCLLLSAFTFITFRSISSKNLNVSGRGLPAIVRLAALNRGMRDIRREDQNLVLCRTAQCTETHTSRRLKAVAVFQSDLKEVEQYITTPEQRAALQQVEADSVRLQAISDRSVALVAAGKVTEAGDLLMEDSTFAAFDATKGGILNLFNDNVKSGIEDAEGATGNSQRATWVNLAVSFGILLLCGFLGRTLTSLIVPPLKRATEALECVAEKDLTVCVEATSSDEIGRLTLALKASVSAIREVLQAVAKGMETLSAAAEELSVQSTQTSGNTQIQTSKINQIAAAAQEMTSSISEISKNVENVSAASRASAERAGEGGTVMEAAVATMEQIGTSTGSVEEKIASLARRSEEIGNVVDVIKEISGQTNLLALNAAIEAARAGEHGRGFAVVAGEVRRLAERTNGATEEIAETIRSIQQETQATLQVMEKSRETVESGMGETARARTSLEAIIGSSKEVESQIHLIAASATQQTAAAGEISESANQIAQLAFENSQASEEASKACTNLASLAHDLDALIGQFRLEEDCSDARKIAGRSMGELAMQYV